MVCNQLAIIVIVAVGVASQYHPGVMERVIAVRQTPGRTAHTLPIPLPPHDAVIAVSDCDEIGHIWLIRKQGGAWERALVADCAGSEATRQWMKRGPVLFEVDGATAKRWGTAGRGSRAEVGRRVTVQRGDCVE